MLDVIVVGAGPAGAVAALIAARAGARVRLLDRASFPRDKLCGDTVNPGALAVLRRLGLVEPLEVSGLRVDGMTITGGDGVRVDARYPDGVYGRALVRRDMDWALVSQAIAAGVEFEPQVTVRRVTVDDRSDRQVNGAVVRTRTGEAVMSARVVIAADGRRSNTAFGLGLARHPQAPRRWAVGAYYEHVGGLTSLGEMHIRGDHYIGVAPLPGGIANVCLVREWTPGRALGNPTTVLTRGLADDALLRERFADARPVAAPVVLGPLAVDAIPRAVVGLLVAGDAAGFVDPMTGDGLRFALRGGELAAHAALRALERGWNGVHEELQRQRTQEFAAKWRFNRVLRSLVAWPSAVQAGEAVASLAPFVLRAVVRYAGDCRLAADPQ
jgi:flavin-dependent dehydrogenase